MALSSVIPIFLMEFVDFRVVPVMTNSDLFWDWIRATKYYKHVFASLMQFPNLVAAAALETSVKHS